VRNPTSQLSPVVLEENGPRSPEPITAPVTGVRSIGGSAMVPMPAELVQRGIDIANLRFRGDGNTSRHLNWHSAIIQALMADPSLGKSVSLPCK